ncbi:MAG TPA: crosslink repair DNA glycosylase YcaQ family protein, partial [Marmoricola sp.]
LERYGPGTEDDIVWWSGATKSVVRTALDDIGAEQVRLADEQVGWVLPDDLEDSAPAKRGAALLPALDPTTMGWKDRSFFLGPHSPEIFDRNGNAGATAWIGGRVVGTWVQTDEGTVVVLPLEELATGDRAALDVEATRLTAWLDGDVVRSVYASPYARAWLARHG